MNLRDMLQQVAQSTSQPEGLGDATGDFGAKTLLRKPGGSVIDRMAPTPDQIRSPRPPFRRPVTKPTPMPVGPGGAMEGETAADQLALTQPPPGGAVPGAPGPNPLEGEGKETDTPEPEGQAPQGFEGLEQLFGQIQGSAGNPQKMAAVRQMIPQVAGLLKLFAGR